MNEFWIEVQIRFTIDGEGTRYKPLQGRVGQRKETSDREESKVERSGFSSEVKFGEEDERCLGDEVKFLEKYPEKTDIQEGLHAACLVVIGRKVLLDLVLRLVLASMKGTTTTKVKGTVHKAPGKTGFVCEVRGQGLILVGKKRSDVSPSSDRRSDTVLVGFVV